MRVLIVTNGSADHGDRSIRSRRLPHLLAALAEREIAVHVALLGDRACLADELRPMAAGVYVMARRLPPDATGLRPIPGAAVELRELVARTAPQIVEGHEPFPSIAASLAARSRDTPSVYRRHHHTGRRRLLIASRLAAHLAHATVVATDAGRRQASRDDAVAASRVLVTPSGTPDLQPVTEREISNWRNHVGIPARAKVVVAISRLRREKGIDVLLRALGAINRSDVFGVILGDGPEAASLRRHAKRCGAAVRLLGHQDDVAVALAAADVVAIPSRRESFGRTTVEAMCAGRPIVASAVGGLREGIEDGVTGCLVPPEDPASLARAIARLIDDRALALRMGRAARARYEARHTIETMADGWAAAWRTLLLALT